MWRGSKRELGDFCNNINSTANYYSFTMEQHDNSINFLNLTLYKGNNCKIETNPCAETFLKAEGCHPKQLICNTPTGQFLRLCRNHSSFTEFQSKAAEMIFQQRGYPMPTLQPIGQPFKLWEFLLAKKTRTTTSTEITV